VSLRTLYLKSYPSINGRNSLKGRKLYDRLKEISEDCLMGYMVLSDEEAAEFSHPHIRNDILSYTLVKRLDPNLIYIEGGLFDEGGIFQGKWRITRSIAEELVASGAVMIVADVDVNRFHSHKPFYKDAMFFLQVSADYGVHDGNGPIHGSDQVSYWEGYYQIVCKPEKMVVSDWLRPVYDGVSEILVGLPVRLKGQVSYHFVASGNRDSTGTLGDDVWEEPHDYCPFASAANWGDGYIVLIAGLISDDGWLERCPDNTKWLINLGQFLVDQASRDRIRAASHLTSPYKLGKQQS